MLLKKELHDEVVNLKQKLDFLEEICKRLTLKNR